MTTTLAAGAQAFQIIVLRTFFASLPEELFEAGRLDGATELRMLLSIALPLAKPILTTLIVLQVNGVWNEFIWPIMVLSRAEFAGYVLVGLPILLMFSFSSRVFVRGMSSGALKM